MESTRPKHHSGIEVAPQLQSIIHVELDNLVRPNRNKNGLAIVVGITQNGPAGVKKDMENMEKALNTLGIVVWKAENAGLTRITAMLCAVRSYHLPGAYKFIVFYFSGHGGSKDGHPFIFMRKNADDDNRLFVNEGIITHLLPKNTPNINIYVDRIFLFDSCLVDDTIKRQEEETIKKEKISIPPHGNTLVAFATSIMATARADPDHGGVWTRYLTKNIVEIDLPLTTIMDLTWEDTVMHFNQEFEHEVSTGQMNPQGPHYTSSSGLIWLQHPDWDSNQSRNLLREKCLLQPVDLNIPPTPPRREPQSNQGRQRFRQSTRAEEPPPESSRPPESQQKPGSSIRPQPLPQAPNFAMCLQQFLKDYRFQITFSLIAIFSLLGAFLLYKIIVAIYVINH